MDIINKIIRNYKIRQICINLRTVGKSFDCDPTVEIFSPKRVSIGDYVYIGPKTQLHGRGDIIISAHVIISSEVIILSSMHHYENAKMMPYDNTEILKPVIIGRCTWIGIRAIIMPGVEIGEGSVVGAGSVVTKSCLPGSILAGNPAQLIKQRDMQHYQNCVKNEQFYLRLKKMHNLYKKEIRDCQLIDKQSF